MAESVSPFQGMSDVLQQSFEQTRKTIETSVNLFQKSLAAPWFASSDLNKKMQGYMETNIAAASEFSKKLTQAKDFQDFWRIQTECIQAQLEAFGEQTKDLSETLTKSATGALKDLSS